jgi:LPXTG-motif cell wall-anchored protein
MDDDGDGMVDEGDGSETAMVDGVDNDGDGVVDEGDGTEAAAAGGSAAGGSAAGGSAAGTSVLPDTGGASLFTLGAGALLVGGGLLARRIFS